MSMESEVREASERFYAALNRMANGDASGMEKIWSHDAAATAMHPIGGREVGWDAVRASFEQVAHAASNGTIEMTDRDIHVSGDVAYEIGVERGQVTLAGEAVRIEHRVTNVYQREAGEWKLIHHHTDISPAMLDVLGRA